jgi:L-asparagine oxygenase
MAFAHENEGRAIVDVAPLPGHEDKPTAKGSGELRWHADNTASACAPDFLALCGVRPDRHNEARTWFADAREIARGLTNPVRETLCKPLYCVRLPPSFAVSSEEAAWSAPGPVFFGPAASPGLRLNLNRMRAVDTAGEFALAQLTELLESGTVGSHCSIQPGEAVICANRRVVHRRTPFRAYGDGKDRWLKRLYMIRDTWTVREYANAGCWWSFGSAA